MTCHTLYGHRKLGKSSILPTRCCFKIALVNLTGPAAFGSEAERTGRQVSGVVKSHFVSRNWKFRRRNSISSTKFNFVYTKLNFVDEIEIILLTYHFRVRNSISCTRNSISCTRNWISSTKFNYVDEIQFRGPHFQFRLWRHSGTEDIYSSCVLIGSLFS